VGASRGATGRRRGPIRPVFRRVRSLRGRTLLELRAEIRVSMRVRGVLRVVTPAAFVRVRVRRRKAEREVELRWPAGAAAPDGLACDGCGRGTLRPAACDDALHLLCDHCLPHAEGRPPCPACRSR